MSAKVQFYAFDNSGQRRIFSFNVKNKLEAQKALARMNQKVGFYKPFPDLKLSEKIYPIR